MKNKKKISFFNNQIYEKRSRYLKPKENFKVLIKILKKDEIKINSEVIDVGCSNGELLFNLKKNFKKYKLTGIDVDKNLIRKAKTICSKDIVFKNKNMNHKNLNIGKFDLVIFSGILSIFNNGNEILKNLLKLTKKDGKIYIFDSLNEYPFNLHIKSVNTFDKKRSILYKNMYSIDFIKNYFARYKKKIKIYPFKLKTNLKKNNKNLILGWTEFLSGKKIVTSGLSLVQKQYWLKIY